jgi:hypothetical protein
MARMALIDIAGAGGGKRGRLGGDEPVLPESSGGPAGWARRNLEGSPFGLHTAGFPAHSR